MKLKKNNSNIERKKDDLSYKKMKKYIYMELRECQNIKEVNPGKNALLRKNY